jgi:hypothetical protein
MDGGGNHSAAVSGGTAQTPSGQQPPGDPGGAEGVGATGLERVSTKGGGALGPALERVADKRDEELTREEWQDKLQYKHMQQRYPQHFAGVQQEIGTVSRLGLLESTGPLLGESPARLGQFRLITAVVTGLSVFTCLALMPQTINGKPHMFSSVRRSQPQP